MGGSACLVLALIHGVVWWNNRTARANLVFSVMAVAVAAFAALELAMMRAETPEQFGIVVRWIHVPVWVIVVSLVVFVRLYLGAGRRWLAWAVVGTRTLSLILNFIFSPNINFREITALRHIPLLGESVSVAEGAPNPWMLIAQFSLLLLVIFVMDATITVWRRGERRRALVVGGSILFFTMAGTAEGVTIAWGIIAMPVTASLFFLGIVAVMACELSYDVLRAATLVRQLQTIDAALHESEDRFRIMADSAPVPIWVAGVDKLCNFFNKPWLEFTGRTIEEEMGNGWAEGVHPDDLQRCFQTYTEAFDARQPFVMQYRLRRHDGHYRWMSDTGVARYDSQKSFVGYIGSCIDITESVRKEEILREFEERVTLAAEAAHLGVWELDIATNEVWMSDSARALFEFDSGTRLDHAALQTRIYPDDRAARESAVKRCIETQGEYDLEYRVLLRDGTLRWIGGRGRCVAKNGKAVRLIGVSIDITSQKQTQDLFRLATEASPSGIILVDDRGRIVLVNSHTEELFGYRREELNGKLVEILLPERFRGKHPGYRREFLSAPSTRAMGAGRELFGLRKDGSEFPVEIGLNPIQTADRLLVMATVLDISARKLAEADAMHHREELGHLGRVAVMGELAASIAHELNQPLSGIISNASAGQRFIQRGEIDLAELSDLLGDIEAAGHRASDVIRGIRGMVKKGHAAEEEVNLNDVVTDVIHMVKPGAMLHSCQLETLLEPNLPSVKANPIQLQQVLINLVMNAFDAMRDVPAGCRKVLIETGVNDGEVRTTVRDYGIGIQEGARDRLFEQFFTTKAKGLGLGLAIVRSIIQAHAGKIDADNAEGGGARFYFTLPVSVAAS